MLMCRDQRTKGTEHSAQSFIISLRLNLTAQVSISISIIPKIVSEQKKRKFIEYKLSIQSLYKMTLISYFTFSCVVATQFDAKSTIKRQNVGGTK